MKCKSVQSEHPCKSVIQTIYDSVKTPGGKLKVEKRLGISKISSQVPV